jgi:c-di-GMP phosphodiesterase
MHVETMTEPSNQKRGSDRGGRSLIAVASGRAVQAGRSLPGYVARQPIYDRALGVVAFELLFRRGASDRAVFSSSDASTAEVILVALADIGLESLTAGRRAWVNMSLEFLLSDRVTLLPPSRVGLEVLEGAHSASQLAARLRQLSDLGYLIVLDDFVLTDATRKLLDTADIVKLDVLALDDRTLARHVAELREYQMRLVAEKVEDRRTFERCTELGFDYFQGYVFGRPETAASRSISSLARTNIELLALLQRPESTLEDLERVISRDVGVSVRLLRYINSAAVSLPRRIASIREAILLLGERQVRNFATLLVLSRAGSGGNELTRIATTRAKMLELIAREVGLPDPDTLFTVGLLSTLDALLDAPMETICAGLPLAADVTAALVARQGRFGTLLTLVIDYEHGSLAEPDSAAITPKTLRDTYLRAIDWADLTTVTLTAKAA